MPCFITMENPCLRGGTEHRFLKLPQFTRSKDPDKYTYTENGSKNRSGGLYELRVENKSVVLMGNSELESRCHIHLLDIYTSKLQLTKLIVST